VSSALVRLFGFPATLVHGDTLVLDRWRWLRRRLPRARAGERLLDVGCGSGAFTIGAARRGYAALGLSWDQRNQRVAAERAALAHAPQASFEVCDVRRLDSRPDLAGRFDVALCLEVIEHVLDDGKLMADIAACLKPGGRLLLTTPSADCRPITREDRGPFSTVEDGGHVRKGYSEETLRALAQAAGLVVEEISTCSGFASQKITWLMRSIGRISGALAWLVVLPLRPLPLLLDPLIARLSGWPAFSIALVARRSA
jgi:2-polyprenyl-3-methyl-5-hydroxy-6-metoxy-1,4-benzoquinol methylase